MQRRTFATIAVIAALLLAGCAGGSPIPSETPSEDARGPAEGTEWTVTITRVVDGDTVEARFPNGETDTIRLLGVDTPETSLGDVSTGDYEGFPETTAARDHLFNWGEQASQYATDTLAGEEVRLVVDEEADRRGYFGRLLAYIYVDGKNFNKQLLTNGYARYYDSDFSQAEAFATVERTARDERRGLWAFEGAEAVESDDSGESTAATDGDESTTETDASADRVTSPRLSVAEINEDAPGNDNENLNGEYIVFENTGNTTVSMGGWTIQDEVQHTYAVPDGTTLTPGDRLTLYTGVGTDTDTELYSDAGSAIWNNGGDTITVENADGEVVLRRPY
jgi:micrococcal nuclease